MTNAIEIIEDARSYAARSFEQAQTYLQQAVSAAYGMAQTIAPELALVDTLVDELVIDAAPAFNDHYAAPMNTAEPPTFQTLWVPELPEFPEAPAALDTANLFRQAQPVFDVQPFADTPPTLNTQWTYPNAPALVFPDTPILKPVTIDDPPQIALPAFNALFEGVEPEIPDTAGRFALEYNRMLPVFQDFIKNGVEDWIATYAPGYRDNLAKLETRLARDIDGGYALSDATELAMFDRLRSRIEAEASNNQQQLLETAAARGFALPQAALMAGLAQVDLAAGDRIAAAATEVTIERAKIELQHVQFCMELMARLSQALQGLFVNYAGTLLQCNEQALGYAKTLTEFLLEMFNAGLKLYQAKLELYRTAAQVYETELKAALAAFDVYRLQLDAAKARMEINAQEVALFEAQIRAQSQRIDAYVAQLGAIRQMAETEKMKIELFSEQVRAYTALVGAKQSEFECYKAAIAGDAARVDAYTATVSAYRGSVEAVAEKSKVGIAQNEAIGTQNRNLVAQYEAELDAFKAEVGAESSRFEGAVRRNGALLDAYKTTLDARVQALRMRFEQVKIDLDAAQTQFRGDLEVGLANAKLILDGVQIVATTASRAAGVTGDIASAAVSATNTMATLEQSTA